MASPKSNSAASLEKSWIPALADGVAKAGDQILADRIWRGSRDDIDIRMAYYGTPFIDTGAQGGVGPAPTTPPTRPFAVVLATTPELPQRI